MSKNQRVQWLDIAKAYAIILVVVGHVVGGYTGNYGDSTYDGFVENTLYIIYTFHMPLFFLLSGYTYALGRAIYNKDTYLHFVKSKVRRLLIPYFVFTTLQILIKLPLQGRINSVLSWKNIPLMVILPVDQFWFIYVLFFLSCLFALIDWKVKNERLKTTIAIAAFVGGVLLSSILPESIAKWAVVPLKVAHYYLYFYCGVMLKRKNMWISWKTGGICAIIFTLFAGICPQISNKLLYSIATNTIMAFSGIGIVLAIAMNLKNVWHSKNLKLIGRETMPIYIIHVLLCAIVRTALVRVGITNFFVGISVGNILSIYVPILLDMAYQRFARRWKFSC